MNIETQLHAAISELRDKGFRFRPFQEETIMRLAERMDRNPSASFLIDAPTGTGKSILSLIGSLLFNKMGKTGYILTSDLGLQDQYERDIERLSLRIPSVRGMDNYNCEINGMQISLGECKMKAKNPRFLSCYGDCSYYSKKEIAATSNTALLNYSYWLLQLNYLQTNTDFGIRDFCFFDEAHKIESIVQSHYTPRIGYKFADMIRDFLTTFSEELYSTEDFSGDSRKLIETCMKTQLNGDILKSLSSLDGVLKNMLSSTKEKFKYHCSNKWPFGTPVPGHISKAQWQIDRISDVHCKIEDYVKFITDEQNLVRIIEPGDDTSASFKNLEETGLIRKTLIDNSKFRVFMSATLGNPENFAKFIGLDDYEYISIDNQFDHSKSPIFYVRGFKMNYGKREENFPKVLKICDAIIDKHSEDRGIIHTGSFSMAKQIIQGSSQSHRMITYDSSKEKSFAIDLFKSKKSSILIGPSLLEGLSFDDDLSRFQVFFKVPFPNISDEFIKKLLELYPEKYMSRTANSVIQGIGRSIRNYDDWAITYILDECFDQLASARYLPESYLKRIIIKRTKHGAV